jgi:parallel beta-helix repeat protein
MVSSTFAVGVKSGDWMKYDYKIVGWPAGTPYPDWLKVEFLSVEGTNATIRATMHMSDGTEQIATMPVDVVAGGQALGLSGLVVPANLTTGDVVYISGYGSVTIAGETSGVYAGANRTVVYASFSQHGTQLIYYWDRQTGVMAEASTASGTMAVTAKARETNMWQAQFQITIYIRADGSIDPPTAPISTLDKTTYKLTSNINSSGIGIVVERDNITIDGKQYTVQGPSSSYYYIGDYGIGLRGRSNVTVRNTTITNFADGIYLDHANTTTLSGNNITRNGEGGIDFYFSSDNNISGNNIANNGLGITLLSSSYNSISRNNITENNVDGIDLYSSFGNSIVGNNLANSYYGIDLDGSSGNSITGNSFVSNGLVVSDSLGNVLSDNLVNGKPLVYLEGASDVVVGDAGQVVLVQCSRIRVENLNLSDTTIGVELWQTNNTEIAESNITNDGDGIHLYSSSNVSISGNNITENGRYGVSLDSSSDNSISGNNITENGWGGIDLWGASDNSIAGNNIIGGDDGITLLTSSNNSIAGNSITENNGTAICLDSSSKSTISGNNITNNDVGICLESSSNNTISRNNITNNDRGISLFASFNNSVTGNNIVSNGYGFLYSTLFPPFENNRVYHNNFINNTKQVDYGPGVAAGSVRVWDAGYLSGGNYWSDYNGTDYYSGPYQNETESDGIGDTQYTISVIDTDSYPLMKPWYQILGDIDFDGKVGLQDLVSLANAYGSKPGGTNWNSNADIDGNGAVGLSDLVILANHYGQHYP